MQKDVIWASPEDSVEQALTKMKACNAGYMMVGQD
jgi:predicted transcriptional regulator